MASPFLRSKVLAYHQSQAAHDLGVRVALVIRYRTGDVGVVDDGECECFRSLPLLKGGHGRTAGLYRCQRADDAATPSTAPACVVCDEFVQETLRTESAPK